MWQVLVITCVILDVSHGQHFGRGSFSTGSQMVRLSSGGSSTGTFNPRSSFGSSTSPFLQAGSPSVRRISIDQSRTLGGQNTNFGVPQTFTQTSSAAFQPVRTVHVSAPTSQIQTSGHTIQLSQSPVPQQTIIQQQPVQHQPVAQQPVQQVQPAPPQPATPSPRTVHLTSHQHGATPTGLGGMPMPGMMGGPMGMMGGGMGMMGGGMGMMGGPMGMMGGPMGMMGGPMGMMGGPMGMMGGPMGMGMPFMSYDTMEDMFLDPDRPDPRGVRPPPGMGAAAAVAAASAASATAARRAAASVPASVGAVPSGVGAASSSTAVASTGVAQPAAAVPAQTGSAVGKAATVDQSMIASALQTALSRVEQRQRQPTHTG